MLDPLPNPLQLFRLFENGRITAAEFREAMGAHQRELIEEIEDVQRDGPGSWLDQIWNRRATSKLVGKHGEGLVREVLLALAEVEDFPPARWLWNAMHPHVPLHVFFRTRRAPLFRISEFDAAPQRVKVSVEHSEKHTERTSITQFVLRRDRSNRLWVESRLGRV
jgi:hypothetical protein